MASMNKRMVPLPPLEIQREIVRMLDSYTESVVELQRQLTAELTARKAQYSYYRDKLLQYETIIEELEIGEVCNLSAGGDVPKDRFSKEKTERYKIPIISNGSGINALYGYTDIPKVVEPSVTVAARGTIGYQGKTYSLSALAQKIMQTTYPLQGPVHWLYQGRKLRDIRVEREEAGLYE